MMFMPTPRGAADSGPKVGTVAADPESGLFSGHCRAVLQDLDPACVVPLLQEDTATVAPMLELAYGETISHVGTDRSACLFCQ